MDRSTALDVWRTLEQMRDTEFEGDPQIFDVRLDAATDRGADERFYRVRISPSVGGVKTSDWQFVMEQAVELGLDFNVDNSAVVLT